MNLTDTAVTPRRAVHTDGSALTNPGPAGWAWWVDDMRWQAGSEPERDEAEYTPASSTNNRMELLAILRAVQANRGPLEIVTDSVYAKQCTVWVARWRRNGWRTAAKKPVKNRDLIAGLDDALAGRDVEFTWVKGHAGHLGNEKADVLARAAAEAVRDGGRWAAGPVCTPAHLEQLPATPACPPRAATGEGQLQLLEGM